MLSRFIGGILLIVGTSIGGGMLALPIANAAAGFWFSSLFLLLCWALMTLGAFFILEVNLYFPPGKNMLSMAATTLGKPGLLITWLTYLSLLYSLLAAYISGGADVFGGLLSSLNLSLPPRVLACLFTVLFGLITYAGIRCVDLANRGLMFAKLGIYFILVLLITPHAEWGMLQQGNLHYVIGSAMIMMTSFGFAIIVPNLREYFQDDIAALKKVIFLGSLIPLCCYILWDAVILGSLPSQGDQGLASLMYSDRATSSLATLLADTLNHTVITALFNGFTSVCMLTAFLGVSLALLSFLGDGLNLDKQGKSGLGLFLLTFTPPTLWVIYSPGAYMQALHYSGSLCVVLLLLLPALMSYRGRKHATTRFIVPGGKITQWFVILSALLLLATAN